MESEIVCRNLAQVIRETSEPVTFNRMNFFYCILSIEEVNPVLLCIEYAFVNVSCKQQQIK